MTTENYFGKKISFTFDNYDKLFDYAKLKIKGISKEKLCNQFQFALIKSIGLDINLIFHDESHYLFDSNKYNCLTNCMRLEYDIINTRSYTAPETTPESTPENIIENEYSFDDLNNIRIPLFILNYLANKEYLSLIEDRVSDGTIKKYSIELFIEFCEPGFIIICEPDENLDLSDVKLEFEFENNDYLIEQRKNEVKKEWELKIEDYKEFVSENEAYKALILKN